MNEDVRRFLTQPRWEVHRRRSVETPVEVFTVTGDGPAGPLIGGSIAIVSGLRDAPLIEQARRLAAGEDLPGLGALLRQWRNEPGAIARAADEDSATALTQISYGGRVIVDGLLVHGDLDALVALVPYAGGALNDEAFKARSWAPRRAGAPPVQTIVICRPPRLTQLEQRVLASLPDDVEAAVIGRPPTAAWPGAEAAEQMLLAAQVDELAAIDDRLRALRDDQFMELDQRFVDDADQLAQQLRAARRQVAAADAEDDFQAAEIQQFLNDRDRDLARQIIDQQLAEDAQIDFLEQQRARLLDDLGERMADRQRVAQDDDAQQDRQEQERQRQEEQRQRQQEEQEQRQRQQEEEQRREDAQRRQDEAAEREGPGGDDDDDGGSLREWLERLENRGVLEGLDSRAAVNVLLQVRSELLRRGAVR